MHVKHSGAGHNWQLRARGRTVIFLQSSAAAATAPAYSHCKELPTVTHCVLGPGGETRSLCVSAAVVPSAMFAGMRCPGSASRRWRGLRLWRWWALLTCHVRTDQANVAPQFQHVLHGMWWIQQERGEGKLVLRATVLLGLQCGASVQHS